MQCNNKALTTEDLGNSISYCIFPLFYELHDIAELSGQIWYLSFNGISTNVHWMKKKNPRAESQFQTPS